ncbi:hypothetical protein K435DRAFT_197423 [Dendrothele bispora CBS 962.96]|uniref:DUF4246 domain-containing protein n=1 Tax=Dendrothele bispora (strain CBS 962.96) TaxID=1314807 RepID=A0A4S8LUL9_DENBC|nr:hypothetical protein K435DRAFT_197423 [Dendrothele bispora CBS 962.96]
MEEILDQLDTLEDHEVELKRFLGVVHSKNEWYLRANMSLITLWAIEEGLLHRDEQDSLQDSVEYAQWLTSTLEREARILKERLPLFAKAILEKKDWHSKILDEERNLPLKWAVEAELVRKVSSRIPSGPVLDTIEELKSRARCIEADDNQVLTLNTITIPQRLSEDRYQSIHEDVLNQVRYARLSKYGIRTPYLKQKVGVNISDDLVPKSLHEELLRELDLLAIKEPKDFHPGTLSKVQDLIHPSLYPYLAGYTFVSPEATTHIPALQPIPDSSNNPLPNLTPFSPKDSTPKMFQTQMVGTTEYDDPIILRSRYAWIPTIFSVNSSGTDVRIQSYINGLGPREQYPDLYRLLEEVFLIVLPQLEKTVDESNKFELSETPSERRWKERRHLATGGRRLGYSPTVTDRQGWDKLLRKQDREKRSERKEKLKVNQEAHNEKMKWLNRENGDVLHPSITTSSAWKGKDLKVIVKAANYILKPGQEYQGTWHMEGMPHERIAASAIYYYDTNEFVADKGLSFRKLRDAERDFPSWKEYNHEDFQLCFEKPGTSARDVTPDEVDHYPSDWETRDRDEYYSIYKEHTTTPRPMNTGSLSRFIKLGTVQTTGVQQVDPNLADKEKDTGRILTFPNWIQHKVEGLGHRLEDNNEKDSADQTALRKIVKYILLLHLDLG